MNYIEIKPVNNSFRLNIKEIWRYRDLMFLFVRRDLVSVYKQTILGPLWYLISPILSSIAQYWVFGKIAKLPSDGVPYFLFILGGNVLWSYFATCFNSTSDTFRANQGIFGKVYFPRAIVPISVTISNLIQFGIKLLMLIFVILLMGLQHKIGLEIGLIPILVLMMALISMGLGMIVSSLTTKYRDFSQLMVFLVSLYMYVTPVIYPTSLFLENYGENASWIIYLNPLTSIFDAFRLGFFGSGFINVNALIYSGIFSILSYISGLLVFNKVEKTFIDTI